MASSTSLTQASTGGAPVLGEIGRYPSRGRGTRRRRSGARYRTCYRRGRRPGTGPGSAPWWRSQRRSSPKGRCRSPRGLWSGPPPRRRSRPAPARPGPRTRAARPGSQSGRAVHRDGFDGPTQAASEAPTRLRPPGVVNMKQADIVEAPPASEAGKEDTLGNVRKRGSRHEIVVGDGDQRRRRGGELTAEMGAEPITLSATDSALTLALGPRKACARSTSTKCYAAATAISGSAVMSTIATVTGKPNMPPASLTCLIASSNARGLSL